MALNSGKLLEEFVAKELSSRGFRIERNVRIRNPRAEIDIIVNNAYLIECKYRNRPLQLKDVARFVAVLDLLKHPREFSAIITNHSFNERALKYCKLQGVNTFNIKQLDDLVASIYKALDDKLGYYTLLTKSFIKRLIE